METIMALCWSESIDGWFDVFLVRGYLNLCLYAGIDSKWRERKKCIGVPLHTFIVGGFTLNCD